MLVYDPAERITAKDVLKHPYFDDLDKSALPAAKFVDPLQALILPSKQPLMPNN